MSSSIKPTIPSPREAPIQASGLAFSTDVRNRNNRKDRYQATVNNMGMERGRMRKEPDNQSSGKAIAKFAARLLLLHLHSDGATKTPMIVTLTQHIIFPILCRTGSRPESTMPAQPLPWTRRGAL